LQSKKAFLLVSEENEEPILGNKEAKYIVTFDPLDGSLNLEPNITVGTIFGIFRKDP
jgi:fructose-1,6-bisphosphatase I